MDDPWMPPISMDFSTSSMDIHLDGPRSIHGSLYVTVCSAKLSSPAGPHYTLCMDLLRALCSKMHTFQVPKQFCICIFRGWQVPDPRLGLQIFQASVWPLHELGGD